jgi:Sec-independent protein secretion pathway component TatC
MTDADSPAANAATGPDAAENEADAARMSFGDHLEELRTRMVRGLLGLAVATILSLIFARRVLEILYRPLMAVLEANDQPTSLLALGIADAFLMFLKMSVLCGLIIATPWMVYQAWMFVAAGLYRHEQRFLRLFGPISGALFAAGVLFLYFVVLPIALNFFVSFNSRFLTPELEDGGLTGLLLGRGEPATTQPADQDIAADDLFQVPVLEVNLTQASPGTIWVNPKDRRLYVQTEDELLTTPLNKGRYPPAVRSEFGLRFYVSFVLTLALAFGIAFEMPVAVVFLAMTGIVTTAMMAKSRRYVIFTIFIASAMLTPPDVISQVMLAVPMIALFEGGLLAARAIERRQKREAAEEAA